MGTRRAISSVVHGFLGTFTSRYSDFDGYWLFGLLVDRIDTLRIDLLGGNLDADDSTPLGFGRRLAALRFSEQMAKAGVSKSWFREAYLDISKLAQSKFGFVNGQRCSGYELRFQAHVITDMGRVYERTASVFVAPHDPKIELRSARRGHE